MMKPLTTSYLVGYYTVKQNFAWSRFLNG